MNPVVKFFHELMNPHCLHCAKIQQEEVERQLMQQETERILNEKLFEYQQEDKICRSCENLKLQLGFANNLINKLTDPKQVEQVIVSNEKQPIIQTRHKPFGIIRNELERASRIKAQELRQQSIASSGSAKPDSATNEKTEELEQAIGINDSVKVNE